MRISQLESLSSDELAMLLYVVNVVDPIRPPAEITSRTLLSIRPEVLSWKLAQNESKLNEHGKYVFKSLMIKLNENPYQEIIDKMNIKDNQISLPFIYEDTTKPVFTQSEFSL